MNVQNCLYMLMVPKSDVEILNSLKLALDSEGNGRFTTDGSQVCKWMSDGDPRTVTFHKTGPTAGNAACSVKRVLGYAIVSNFLKCTGPSNSNIERSNKVLL